MSYVVIPIPVDAEDIVQEAVSALQVAFPGWTPNPSALDAAILLTWGTESAQLRELATNVPDSIFRFYGATLMGLPPVDATPAEATTTWTVLDDAGYTIPAGTQVSLPTSTGDRVAFSTTADVAIPPGSTTATPVSIFAMIDGLAGSGLGTVGGVVQLEDPLAFVSSISQLEVTTGGLDAEDDSTYLNRLTEELTLQSPRLILPSDFAIYAQQTPDVWRCLALDGYNPGDGTYSNPRMITLCPIDIDGVESGSGTQTAVLAAAEALREVNFLVYVIGPTSNPIDVAYSVQSRPGVDPTGLEADCDAALETFLSPANWGQDEVTVGDVSPRTWTIVTIVRYLDLATILHNVAGVEYVVSLTLCAHGGSPGTADVDLTGAAPLTAAGTIAGTVS